ncbi:MAG TPA: type I-U CRISPR-associated protein Csb2 [Streptosporangiaceae bacterium]|nr:type I-U CRISPR-associated protein Csb2 [Streptosporangiaceae bacterium]
MPLVILARLRNGRYDAATIRPDVPEWPPHPARLFCALTASAASEGDWAALRWLEMAGTPEVWASSAAAATAYSGYVVTNTTDRRGGSQSWPGRTNGLRTRCATAPADAEFAVFWPGAQPDAATREALSRLARRVPYLGRATCPVTLLVGTELAAADHQWTRYVPVQSGQPRIAELRVPYPGYTSELQDAYAGGRRAWEVGRAVPYGLPVAPAGREAASPYADMVVFGLARGAARFPGASLLSLTVTLRQAVMSRIGTGIPFQVSGHGVDGRPHVAYLALVDAGHPHADGHVLGVALALPRQMPPSGLAQVAAAVLDDPLTALTVRRGHEVSVGYEPFRSAPAGLLPERWTALSRSGSTQWVTATPMMLDRYPRRGHTVLVEVGETLVRAGYPEPADVEVSPAAMIPGAVHRPVPGTIPAGRPRRPVVHARVTFRERVTGPVLAGSMRYLGLGLFAPERRTS